jgi:hypothetical protein
VYVVNIASWYPVLTVYRVLLHLQYSSLDGVCEVSTLPVYAAVHVAPFLRSKIKVSACLTATTGSEAADMMPGT